MKLGYIGLGKMGKNMVLRLLEQRIEVVAWNRTQDDVEEVVKAGAVGSESVEDLVNKLRSDSSLRGAIATKQSNSSKEIATSANGRTRNDGVVVWLMLPAGAVTDEYIDKLLPLLQKNDLIIDGANSFYKDTLRRAEKFKTAGIHFMDIGVSGGPGGARNGACMMIGGDNGDVDRVMEVVKAASAPDAFGHFGPVGAGHFAKMVHNGIEYGMMEAIGEGASLLKHGPFKLDLAEVFRVYQHRSVIESRLVGWTQEALSEDADLKEISSEIKSTGEGEWTIKVAEALGVDIPVIRDSFQIRQNSVTDPEDSPEGFRNKIVSAMRGKFGQHEVKKS